MLDQRVPSRIAVPVFVAAVLVTSPLAAAGPPPYHIVDLTERAEPLGVVQSEARAINEAGRIVGFELLPDYLARGIVWEADGTPSLVDVLGADNSTLLFGIDPDGNPLGVSSKVTVVQQGDLTLIFEDQKAAVWQNGVPVDLNTLVIGGDPAISLFVARSANTAGQLVGFAGLPEGPPFNSNGFLLEDGIVTDLGLLERPVAINESGQIVGYTQSGQAKAILWDDGVITNLHDHPAITGVTSRAYDIGDGGLIVGEAQFHISKPEEPTVWIDTVPVRLVPDFNRPQGIATGVNGRGQIVGFYNDLDDLNSPWIAFVWEDGVRTDLLDLVDPAEGWEVLFPFDINERGQIVGGGLRNGEIGHGFVMTPVCAGDVDGDGAIGFDDLLAVLSNWGPCPGCPEDVTGDDEVGFEDLLLILTTWGACR